MGDIFVNFSGNDSNGGTSHADAKLTIGGAEAIAGNSDRIVVGSGVYNEAVLIDGATNVDIIADGLVILDGQGSLSTGLDLFDTSSNCGEFANPETGFIVKDYISVGIKLRSAGASAYHMEVSECPTGIQNIQTGVVEFCVTHDCTTGIEGQSGGAGGNFVRSCTMVDCDTGLKANVGTAFFREVKDCIIAFCDRLITIGSSNGYGTTVADFNNLHFIQRDTVSTADADFQTTIVTTIAAWRTASGKDANSISTNPLFGDLAKDIFTLQKTSPSASAGSGIPPGRQGARRVGFTISNNTNSSLWTGGTFSNTQINGNGDLELISTPGTGTFESDDVDLGESVTPDVDNDRIYMPQNIVYPGQVADSNNADTQPNRLTIEMKVAATQAGLGAAAYAAIEPGALISPVHAGPFRWVKYKITLRTDGVAA